MKIVRSTKCSLQFATDRKKTQLRLFLVEYVRVVNLYIDLFWFDTPENNNKLVKVVLDKVEGTWLAYNAKVCAARQALGIVKGTKASHVERRKERKRFKSTPKKPRLRRLEAHLSSLCAKLIIPKRKSSFDTWLHFSKIGNKTIIDIPIKFHSPYFELAEIGTRCKQFIITEEYIQIPFRINVAPKLLPTGCIGIDTGMNALASTSTGEQFGTEMKDKIERVKRCQHGSKGQKRARRALRQYIDQTVNKIMAIDGLTLVVVEKLEGITKNTRNPKRRLGKNMRCSIGTWNVAYWLKRLEMACERNRVSFRRVAAYNTSRTCPVCDHCNKKNRQGLSFVCRNCGYADNSDIAASKTILNRYFKFGDGAGLIDRRKDCGSRILPDSLSGQQDIAAQQRDEVKFTESK